MYCIISIINCDAHTVYAVYIGLIYMNYMKLEKYEIFIERAWNDMDIFHRFPRL